MSATPYSGNINEWVLYPHIWHRGWSRGPCVIVKPKFVGERRDQEAAPNLDCFPSNLQALVRKLNTLRRGLPDFTHDSYNRDEYEAQHNRVTAFKAAFELCQLQGISSDKELIEYWRWSKEDLVRMFEVGWEQAKKENLIHNSHLVKVKAHHGVVYAIQCEKTNQVYIGETRDERHRRQNHFSGEFSTTRVLTMGPYKDSLKWIVLHREGDKATRLRLEKAQRKVHADAGWTVINVADTRTAVAT